MRCPIGRAGALLVARPRRPGLPDEADLPQPSLVDVLSAEGKLIVGETAEVTLLVVDARFRRPALLPEHRLYLVEGSRPAAAHLEMSWGLSWDDTEAGKGSSILYHQRIINDIQWLPVNSCAFHGKPQR